MSEGLNLAIAAGVCDITKSRSFDGPQDLLEKKKWHKVNEVAVSHFFGVYGQGADVNTGQCSM